MKKVRIFGISLCLNSMLAIAQPQLIKDYDLNFNTTYSNEADAQYFDKDGSFYVVSGSKNFGSVTSPVLDPVLIKLNSNGSLAGLNKRYLLPGNQHSNHVTTIASNISKSDAGYLLSGVTEQTGSVPESNFLIKTDLNGTITWKKNYSFTNASGINAAMRITQVIQASTLKVYVVGMLRTVNEQDDQELVILRLDPFNGNIDWYRVYQCVDYFDLRATGIIEGQPGKFKVFGEARNSSASFIFSFQEGLAGPVSTSFKLVSMQRSGTIANVNIKAMHYYQSRYIIGSDVSHGVQNAVTLFKLDNNLNNPMSLGGVVNTTNSYLNPNFPNLTHITNNSTGLILSGQSSGSLPYASFVMLVGTNGSVLNVRKGKIDLPYATTSVDCFSEGAGFSTLHPTVAGSVQKLRFSKYSNSGFTCKDSVMPPSNSYTYSITLYTKEELLISRPIQTVSPAIPVVNFQFAVTDICEKCVVTPTAGPITTSNGGTTFCVGTPYTLYAPAGFSYYNWVQNGNALGNGASVNITSGGVFDVHMLDENGCEAVQTITITSYSGCVINTSPPDITYCSLSPGTIPAIGWNSNPLAGCSGKWSFTWYYNGAQVAGGSYTTPFQGPGVYTVEALTPCGLQTFNITVTDLLVDHMNAPVAAPNWAPLSPYVTFTPAVTPPVSYTYSWTVVNVSAVPPLTYNSTSSSIYISPYALGESLQVTLILTDLAGCTRYHNTITWSDNATGKMAVPTNVGVTTGDPEHTTKISPNPTTGRITLELHGLKNDQTYQLAIVGIDGKVLDSRSLLPGKHEIDLSSYSNGVYFIKVNTGSETYVQKLIKN